jgi:hypothetical protein
MKKYWLRGMLLGVSMALLLAGGVALAASLDVDVVPKCTGCWDGPWDQVPEEYIFTVIIADWDARYQYCNWWTIAGEIWAPDHCWTPWDDPNYELYFIPCGGWPMYIGPVPELSGSLGAQDGATNNADGAPYGEMRIRGWQVETGESDEVAWLYAEDCFAATFVPEPGTIVLLGGGLAGLAGYATLRWRTRE